MRRSEKIGTVSVFGVLVLLFGAMVMWLGGNNFVADSAQYSWVAVRAIFDAESLRLENLGFDHPHGPILLLAPFYLIPQLQPISPFIISVAATALLMTLWYRQMSQGGYSFALRFVLLSLMVVNPAVLWSATAGGGEALALLLFYLLYRSCLRMVYDNDIRSFIALGLVLAAFFYFNVISVYLFAALLPLLILIVPIPQLRESPLGAYIIMGMPLLIMVASWIYFNWIFHGEPLAFINELDSAFIGAKAEAETTPWLMEYGGHVMKPMMVGLLYTLAAYPVLVFLMWLSYRQGRNIKITLVLMLHPIISVGVATFTYFLASPLQITVLIAATVMAEIGRLDCQKTRCFSTLVILLAIGAVTSWYLFVKEEYSHVRPWTSALVDKQADKFSGDMKVGQWLAGHREPTMIDLQSGYRAIAARGDAIDLLLPFSHEYRLAMRSDHPLVDQIAIPNPDEKTGRHDEINLRFPRLYESGIQGYERVYDADGWRVYRRQH